MYALIIFLYYMQIFAACANILCFDARARVHFTLLSSRPRGARLHLIMNSSRQQRGARLHLMNVQLTDSPVANITTMEAAVA